MSWFGETFGDSLNSLKGQITKITKEVLAEDVTPESENRQSEFPLVKELEALCESKDVEIACLRDEINKLRNRYEGRIESLRSSNETESGNSICDNDDLSIKKLENDLVVVRQERDHLNSCLEELQAEHQTHLDQVISLRDKYKSELEELKQEHENVKSKLAEALNTINENNASPDRGIKINFLHNQIKELHLHFEKEKKALYDTIIKEAERLNSLKEQLNKLLAELQEVRIDKEKVENDRKIIQTNNENLKNKLALKEKEIKEAEIKLKLLSNEKDDLLRKCQSQELIETKLSGSLADKAEVQEKLENLLQVLNVNSGKESDMCKMIDLVESEFNKKCSEMSKNWKDVVNDLELELKTLREENKNYQEKLKILIEKEVEVERKHQEEISVLKSSFSEIKNQQEVCMNESQTDDVKRLEQEMTQCMGLILAKDQAITDYSNSLQKLEQELKDLKGSSLKIEEELEATKKENMDLHLEMEKVKDFSLTINQVKNELEEKQQLLEAEKKNLNQINNQLKTHSSELEKQISELMVDNQKLKGLQEELQRVMNSKSELSKRVEELQNENMSLKNEFEYSKAQGIVKESSLAELMKANMVFQNKVAELQAQCTALLNLEKEKEKWKDASISLQIQIEDLTEKKEEVENECLKLKSELEGLAVKEAEIQQLKLTNSNLMKSCNELHHQLELKAQEQQSFMARTSELDENCRTQLEITSQLQEENNELKSQVEKLEQELKTQMLQSQNLSVPKDSVQQHRRSRSAAGTESPVLLDVHQSQASTIQNDEELTRLKQALKQEQTKYQLLQQQFQEISNKESSARKEFERLKQHLIEIEDHYTEETIENEKIINDLKSKLVAAEEQLQNSSTLYTSLKVRDNQHLESLQSQIRMVSAQRDDLQAKLSAAEDEVQKHKASLMSLQIVLEQFQQDKEREIEQTAMKYEKKLQQADARYKSFELEIDGLKKQLAEAKNGLQAASRLGEQLEKKTQQVSELEENQSQFNMRIAELEQSLAAANQANNGKVDVSLIKNLVIGYILSPNAERKSQVLRIMASVLDFNQEERSKMGVDASQSGWLSSILHPKGEGRANNQSLSEAFIRFLESESRPQPQLKLLPEQLQPGVSRTSRTNPKPSPCLSELTLPTFNSSQDNDSSIILKNVLKDS